MKSEASSYSIDDLARDKRSAWTGVRNYQARNYMQKDMRVGDDVLFYHSSSDPTGVVGLAKVSALAHPDLSALDKKSHHFDPTATKENPRWFCVDIDFVKKFKRAVELPQLRANKKLKNMMLLQKGSRLSIQPVSELEFNEICRMAAE